MLDSRTSLSALFLRDYKPWYYFSPAIMCNQEQNRKGSKTTKFYKTATTATRLMIPINNFPDNFRDYQLYRLFSDEFTESVACKGGENTTVAVGMSTCSRLSVKFTAAHRLELNRIDLVDGSRYFVVNLPSGVKVACLKVLKGMDDSAAQRVEVRFMGMIWTPLVIENFFLSLT